MPHRLSETTELTVLIVIKSGYILIVVRAETTEKTGIYSLLFVFHDAIVCRRRINGFGTSAVPNLS